MNVGIGVAVRRFAVIAALGMLGVTLGGVQGASAGQVSPSAFTCGITVFTPCNQTAHFTTDNEVGTPLTGATSCPAFLRTDFVTIIGTGNGIEHSIINNAGDGWFTSTFTGTVTVTAYTDATLKTRDTNVPPFTGRLTEWFGGSFNKNNQVFHFTIHFTGAAQDGTTLKIFALGHSNTTPNPALPAHTFGFTSC
jgi:hypothetical protein